MRSKTTIHPVRYVDGRIVASDKDVWTWFRVPHSNTALRGVRAKEADASRFTAMLRAILGDSQEPVEMHVRTVNRLFDTQTWYDALFDRTDTRPHPPRFDQTVNAMADHLDAGRTLVTETYVGVKLGHRDQAAGTRTLAKDLVTSLTSWVSRATHVESEVFTPDELAFWHTRADDVFAAAENADPRIEPVPARQMVWLLRKPFYPTYGCPDLDIPAQEQFTGEDLAVLTTADLHLEPNHVKVTQTNPMSGDVESFYTAVTCLTEFNRSFAWPQELGWAEVVNNANPNAEWSIRLQVVPPAVVRKAVKKNLGVIQDELVDAHKASRDPGRHLGDQAVETEQLDYELTKDRTGWLYVTYRVQVRASSPEQVQALHVKLQTELRNSNITVAAPAHDQLDLLMEAVPTGRWLQRLYQRKQSLNVLGAGGLTSNYEVGDQEVLGPYIGRVVDGNTPPVFFNTNRGIALNRPPTTLVTGSPGRGKSFLAFNLAYQCAIQGYKVVYIDPKADALPFADLPGLGNVNLFDLRNGHDGLLDPFRLGENTEAAGLLALEVLRLLVGHLSEERETVLANAIESQKRQPNPSLWNLSEELAAAETGTPEYNMGALLKNLRSVPFGRLLFSPTSHHATLDVGDGVSIITLLGLDTPGLTIAAEDYSYDQRIAVAVMYLLTKYAYGLMELGDKSYPKTLFLDEAWAVLSTRSGRALIERWGRMGRSHNAALVLITQNTSDFEDSTILNQVSTRFAFGADDRAEHESILRSLDVPVDESTLQLVAALATRPFIGHCLMRDPLGRVGLVRIDTFDAELFETFNTNPESRRGR